MNRESGAPDLYHGIGTGSICVIPGSQCQWLMPVKHFRFGSLSWVVSR